MALAPAFFLEEVPLRGTARGTATDVGEGLGCPEGANAQQQPFQIAVARLLQRKGRTHLPRVRESPSGAMLGAEDGWNVGQVYLRARQGRVTTVEEISRRYDMSAAVLETGVADATRHGDLTDTDGALKLTRRGQEVIGKVMEAMRAWLAEESNGLGRQDAQLGAALGDLATTFVEQAPSLTSDPDAALVGRPGRG